MKGLRCCVAFAMCFAVLNTPAQLGQLERAKGFKLVDYYSSGDGAQKKRAVLTASEGQILTNNVSTVFLVHPRIEHYREDGSLLGIATALDAFVNVQTHTAWSTNLVSFRDANTNLYLTGQGFLWQPSNSVLIIYNQSYTWMDRSTLTNSSSKK